MMTLTGDKSLDAFFRDIPEKAVRREGRKGLRKIGTEAIKRARQHLRAHGIRSRGRTFKARKGKDGTLNLSTGLYKSLTQRPSSQWPSKSSLRKQGIIGTAFGPRWPDGAHGHLVEFGHRIVAHKGSVNFSNSGKRTQPKPFLRPAVMSMKSRAISILKASITSGLAREAAKARSKSNG